MKKLIIITPNLKEASTGGLIWQRLFALHARKVYAKTSIIDAMQLPAMVRNNRLVNILYYIVYVLRKNDTFLFVDHNLHVRLSIALLLGKLIKQNEYGVICHHVVYGLRKNILRRYIEAISERFILSRASLIIAPSMKTSCDIQKLNVRRDKIVIINPTFVFRSDRFPVRKPGRKLLFVGNLEPRKGLEILIRALSLIHSLKFSCDIVGGCYECEKYFEYLKRLTAQLGLADRISFRGILGPDSIVECYEKANIFVFPSLHEGFGMVLREAMSFGLPVVASDVAPMNEIIKDGTNGYLFPPGDVKILADVLHNLLLDHRTQRKFGWRNFEQSRHFPSWDVVVSETFDALKPYLYNEHSN